MRPNTKTSDFLVIPIFFDFGGRTIFVIRDGYAPFLEHGALPFSDGEGDVRVPLVGKVFLFVAVVEVDTFSKCKR